MCRLFQYFITSNQYKRDVEECFFKCFLYESLVFETKPQISQEIPVISAWICLASTWDLALHRTANVFRQTKQTKPSPYCEIISDIVSLRSKANKKTLIFISPHYIINRKIAFIRRSQTVASDHDWFGVSYWCESANCCDFYIADYKNNKLPLQVQQNVKSWRVFDSWNDLWMICHTLCKYIGSRHHSWEYSRISYPDL